MLKRLGKTLNPWNRSLMTAWQTKAFLGVWERVWIAVVFQWLQNTEADVRGKSSGLCQCSTTLFIQSQGQCHWPRGACGRGGDGRHREWRGGWRYSAPVHTQRWPLPLAILLWPITLASLSKCTKRQGEGRKLKKERWGRKKMNAMWSEQWQREARDRQLRQSVQNIKLEAGAF